MQLSQLFSKFPQVLTEYEERRGERMARMTSEVSAVLLLTEASTASVYRVDWCISVLWLGE
jgi:hypothetical protein